MGNTVDQKAKRDHGQGITSTAQQHTQLTWLELSDRELRSDLRRVTMTEGLWSVRFRSLRRWGQLADKEVCSWSNEVGSARRTGTDTGITSGTRLSSLTRLALKPSISSTPRPGPDAGGLQDL